MSLSDTEKAIVRAILVAAGVKRAQLDWMIASCPSVERAREFYSRSYRAPAEPVTRPPELYAGVREAGERIRWAQREGDDDKATEAFSALQTEIAIVYWRMENDPAMRGKRTA